MDFDGDELFNLHEAAAILKTSIRNLKRLIYHRKILATKVGTQWRIRKSEISSYLEVNSRYFR